MANDPDLIEAFKALIVIRQRKLRSICHNLAKDYSDLDRDIPDLLTTISQYEEVKRRLLEEESKNG